MNIDSVLKAHGIGVGGKKPVIELTGVGNLPPTLEVPYSVFFYYSSQINVLGFPDWLGMSVEPNVLGECRFEMDVTAYVDFEYLLRREEYAGGLSTGYYDFDLIKESDGSNLAHIHQYFGSGNTTDKVEMDAILLEKGEVYKMCFRTDDRSDSGTITQLEWQNTQIYMAMSNNFVTKL